MIDPEELFSELEKKIAEARSLEELNQLRVNILGRKGQITSLLRGVASLSLEQRKELGSALNRIKGDLERLIEERESALEEAFFKEQEAREYLDVTLPGVPIPFGRSHPLLTVMEDIEDTFLKLGFDIVEGPEVEWDYYNFEALNIPQGHPARDMWDTYYITDKMLLRTHTSPVQIRCMEKEKPPIRAIMPGLCFRHEAVDATHMDTFFQIEGLVIDKDITFANLKGTLNTFVQILFGQDRKSKFVPSYFPFTEPSAELEISCGQCLGEGCPSCGGKGWLEVLGCGEVHPQVLRNVGIDPEIYSGFAFGLGVERIAMLRYAIPEIRLFWENDPRFLKQFK